VAWYTGTYSCGHEGKIQVFGALKDRQWKINWTFSGLCPECYKQKLADEKAKINAQAMEAAKEMELPELQGTEKQVAWANTLRLELIKKFDDIDADELNPEKITYDELMRVKDYILETKTKASWYIDHRNKSLAHIVLTEKDKALQNPIQNMNEIEVKAESTVFPENKITDSVAEITVTADKVTVICEKNDTFREIVKSLGYKWNGIWEKAINEITGSAAERAAELGNKLLNAGFPIMIIDEEIRQNAIDGNYEPECTRWIFHRKDTDCFSIVWTERNDDLYKKAKSLPGAKWQRGMLVKVNYYKEVQEFAGLYGFKFTTKAKQLIETYVKSLEKATVVSPAVVKATEQKDGLAEILESEAVVLDDLKD